VPDAVSLGVGVPESETVGVMELLAPSDFVAVGLAEGVDDVEGV